MPKDGVFVAISPSRSDKRGEKGLLICKKVGKIGITFFVFKINAHILLAKNL